MSKKNYNILTSEEKNVIINKGTEKPFSGKYNDFFESGSFICKQCNSPLYNSKSKFKSGCGWPSFDDEINDAIKRQKDADGRRAEILCAKCSAHLGHVFEGEKLTSNNVRHCVNSISLTFVPDEKTNKTAYAYFAGGCFWGVEYHFDKKNGVISAVSGYMGGTTESPTYEDVCRKKTGHLETVEIMYNPDKTGYEELAKLFFEIHDFSQTNGQGPDIGEQYLSAVFYNNNDEKEIVQKLIDTLKNKGFQVATKLIPANKFWNAEEYHQDYYLKSKKNPYCHFYKKIF